MRVAFDLSNSDHIEFSRHHDCVVEEQIELLVLGIFVPKNLAIDNRFQIGKDVLVQNLDLLYCHIQL